MQHQPCHGAMCQSSNYIWSGFLSNLLWQRAVCIFSFEVSFKREDYHPTAFIATHFIIVKFTTTWNVQYAQFLASGELGSILCPHTRAWNEASLQQCCFSTTFRVLVQLVFNWIKIASLIQVYQFQLTTSFGRFQYQFSSSGLRQS